MEWGASESCCGQVWPGNKVLGVEAARQIRRVQRKPRIGCFVSCIGLSALCAGLTSLCSKRSISILTREGLQKLIAFVLHSDLFCSRTVFASVFCAWCHTMHLWCCCKQTLQTFKLRLVAVLDKVVCWYSCCYCAL